jgi:hypothetical protein
MKLYLVLLLFVSLGVNTQVFSQQDPIFVGEIRGQTLESFNKNAKPQKELNLPNITSSPYRIEIRLYEAGNLGLSVCTVLYLDTIFRRRAYRADRNTNNPAKVKPPIVPNNDADSIFQILVSNGIFSIQSLDFDSFGKKYIPKVLTSQGLAKSKYTFIDDGVEYVLEYKIDNFYGQIFFENARDYSNIYKDNQLLRRQKEIVSAITTGIEYMPR